MIIKELGIRNEELGVRNENFLLDAFRITPNLILIPHSSLLIPTKFGQNFLAFLAERVLRTVY